MAEADFFRLRWSAKILDETENAICSILTKRGDEAAADHASKARKIMEQAFDDAMIGNCDSMLDACKGLPDPGDAHVLAAALKTQAAVIVTENVKDFPEEILSPVNLEVRTTDAFIADTIALDPGRAVAAVRAMRLRLKRPEKTADQLLLDMEAVGLIESADVLRPHVQSI